MCRGKAVSEGKTNISWNINYIRKKKKSPKPSGFTSFLNLKTMSKILFTAASHQHINTILYIYITNYCGCSTERHKSIYSFQKIFWTLSLFLTHTHPYESPKIPHILSRGLSMPAVGMWLQTHMSTYIMITFNTFIEISM